MSTEALQVFMMACGTLEELEKEAGCTYGEAEQRVLSVCINETERFRDLALALFRYDYHEAPSNWSEEYKHENTVFEWAKHVLEEEDEEDINEVLDEYERGLIPDCYNFMENYFC